MIFDKFITSILFLLPFTACADFYDVPLHEASWETIESPNVCLLRQKIPNYGSAEFLQRSGAPLQFSIQELRIKALIIKADLAALPSPWMHRTNNRQIHPVYLDRPDQSGDYARLSVYGISAEAMIDALLEGYSPTFTYVRAVTELEMNEIRVAVSPIKFNDVYMNFSNCRTKVLSSRSHNGF
ncbi:MAG: hypothetical protein ACU84J_10560 [Gammaproteobacteria bacterium]